MDDLGPEAEHYSGEVALRHLVVVANGDAAGKSRPIRVIRRERGGELGRQVIKFRSLHAVIDLTENLLGDSVRIHSEATSRLANSL